MKNARIEKLKRLIKSNGVSGYENDMEVMSTIQTIVGKKGDVINDNLIYKVGIAGKKILVSAHMDEVGFFITSVSEKCFRIMPIGDIDIKSVIGEKLVFRISESYLVTKKIEQTLSFSKLNVKGIVDAPIGSVGTFKKLIKIKNNQVIAPSLDNRVGCLTLTETLRSLKNKQFSKQIFFCFTPREETGMNGIMNVARKINPDFCIDIDSAYAKPLQNSDNWSVPEIGKGPSIQLQGTNFIIRGQNRNFVERICRENAIPYQYEIPEGNSGGTSGSTLSTAGFDLVQINIPVANQHSAKSVASITDIDQTIQLLTKMIIAI